MFIFSFKGFGQNKTCDIKQLQVITYDFAVKNLDSIKKYSATKDKVTAVLEFTEKGSVSKTSYYTAYGATGQNVSLNA